MWYENHLGKEGYNISHMVLGLMETVRFNVSFSFEIWVEIQGHGGVGLVALKVDVEDIKRNVNRNQKGFFWVRKYAL